MKRLTKRIPNNSNYEDYLIAKGRPRSTFTTIESQKNNMEYDLLNDSYIREKVRSSDSYAQNLYAAMCNQVFMKNEVIPILKEETWSCSWRYAGTIVANIREEGDYMNWYCSGTFSDDDGTPNSLGFVPECIVTDEIRTDLFKLGWLVVPE